MITVYTIVYNEEIMIDFFINHYLKKFPQCKFIIYDNESTDNTIKIAKQYDCQIISHKTNNTLSHMSYVNIKNHCWKKSTNNWNIICDCDELIEVCQEDLLHEEKKGTNCLRFKGYSMMNKKDEINIENMTHGFRDKNFDKMYLFNKKDVIEINYSPGCHKAKPVAKPFGKIHYSQKKYCVWHYKYLSPQYTIDRNSIFRKRSNQKKLGIHYFQSNEQVFDFYKNQKLVNLRIKLI